MQKTLLIRGSGGLSNRLQAVLAGIAYCLLTSRRLYVDWRDGMYSDDFSNVFPQWFRVTGVESVAQVPALPADGEGLYPPFWREWLPEAVAVEYLFENDHLSAENVARTSIDFCRLDYEQELIVAWAADLQPALALAGLLRQAAETLGKPFLRDYLDQDIVRWLAREYLHLQEPLAQRVEEFAARNFCRPRTVGLHIRHTDLQSPLEAMLNCLRHILEAEQDGDGSTVFVCTDNRHVQATVASLFPNTVFTPKVFPAGGEPLHCFVPELSNVQKGEEALIDMYLLSKCDEIIYYSQSSFSRIPVLLACLAEEKIHAL